MDTSFIFKASTWLQRWQDALTQTLRSEDPQIVLTEDPWEHHSGGKGLTRVFKGPVFEKAGVNFSHVRGPELPKAATLARPHLSGAPFEAMGTSTVIHPNNPFVPTVHANLRFIVVHPQKGPPTGWFGGGFDMTPYYPFLEDAQHWHTHAHAACQILGPEAYPRYKEHCDRYFYLPHRKETRGIGGLFFDDVVQPDLETVFQFIQSVGHHFIEGYRPIVQKRKHTEFSPQNKQFQRYRRGRYVEFNLLYDRGTHFGLQSGGRTESILMSLPPEVCWDYNVTPQPGSPEAQLNAYLRPRDWLQDAARHDNLASF